MQLLKNRTVITLLLLLVYEYCWSQHNYKFERFTIEDGLSQNTVRCIIQDQKGFIWVGTADGLNKFDGYQFETYKNDPTESFSISNNAITSIYESSDNEIWIGTEGGGLNLYNRQQDYFKKFLAKNQDSKSLKSNTIFSVIEDNNKRIWLGTDKAGLQWLENKEKGIFRRSEALKDKSIWSLVKSNDDNIWVGTITHGLFKYFPGRDEVEKISLGIKNAPVNIRAILEEKNGNLWIGTEGFGLFLIKGKEIIQFKNDQNNNNSISSDFVWELFQDYEGRIWVGTDGGGLNLFDKTTRSFIHFKYNNFDPKSISSNTIRSIYQDISGNLWIGTYAGGINNINFSSIQFAHLKHWDNIKNSLSHNSVISIAKSQQNGVWLGTDGGGLNFFDIETNSFTHYTKSNGLSDNVILSVLEDKKGNVWAGSYTGGLMRMNTKTKKVKIFKHNAYNKNSLSNNSVWALLQDSDDNIWIGTNNGGLNLYQEKQSSFIQFTYNANDKNSLINNDIRSLYEDSKGNIWIGTFKGISVFNKKSKQFTSYTHKENTSNSLSHNIVVGIYEDSHNNIWVATYGGGLNLFNRKNKNFIAYREKDGLPNDVIHAILEDDNNNLWLSTNRGISKFINAVKTPLIPNFKNYDTDDGLQSKQFNLGAASKTKNGKMYFGGINGFNTFFPDAIKDNAYVPPIIITKFSLFNKAVKPGINNALLTKDISETKKITLDHTQSVFSFDFVALNYTNAEKNNYAYRMKDFENNWNYVGSKRSASYTNLDAGKYTFEVKGSNNDDVWNNTGTSIELTILPPFWETLWFRGSILVLIISSFVAWYKIRTRSIKLRNKLLKRLVNEKTSELQSANEDLEDQKQEIIKQNEAISQQSEELQVQRDNLEEINKAILTKNEEIASLADTLKIVNQDITIKNEKLTDSISYAKNIQNAILPNENEIAKYVKDHFIIFRPKDIVSGDFYWFTQIDDNIFISAVDCTGHGVPGAFMSMIGYSLLNRIVNELKIFDPAQILTLLNKTIISSLKQTESRNKDGMDLGLCKIVYNKNGDAEITFAGAKNSLYHFKKNEDEPIIFKGNRTSIGGNSNLDKEFQNQTLSIQKGEKIYLSTDGFIDQNNKERKRFGTPKFICLLKTINTLSMQEQKNSLEQALENYKQGVEQRDDITVIGLHI